MDQERSFKQAAQVIEELSTKLKTLLARLEDIHFRSTRLATWWKNQTNAKAVPPDRTFPDDLKLLHRDIKRFFRECDYIPTFFAKMERGCVYDPSVEESAVKLYRLSSQAQKEVLALLPPIQLAHQQIRPPDVKIDAWFMAQEVESFAKEFVSIPLHCSKIVLKISTDPTKDKWAIAQQAHEDAAAAMPPAATRQNAPPPAGTPAPPPADPPAPPPSDPPAEPGPPPERLG